MNKLTFVPSQGMGVCSFIEGIVPFHQQCVDFCGLELSLESGDQSGFWREFSVFSKSAWDEEMKLLCQNCDEFIFCG